MLPLEITRPVTSLRGAGPALAARLARLGVTTVGELLMFLPRGYEDRTSTVALAQAHQVEKAAVAVEVVSRAQVGWGRARTPRVVVSDASGEASLLCFGRAFLWRVLEEGKRFLVWGSFKVRRGVVECSDFELEPWSESPVSFGRILPLYPLTEGLTQAAVRKLVRQALDEEAAGIECALPGGAGGGRAALEAVHFPSSIAEAEAARHALAHEELLLFQLVVLRRRLSLAAARPARGPLPPGLRGGLLARLAFRLTADQETSLAEIEADLAAPTPMARLLQGEVGSGKTLVALLAALGVIPRGEQAAFVAPTELLARQHAENAARLLEPLGVRVAFLSGGVPAEARGLLLAALRAGEVDLVFGTHALFSADVAFRRLGLVIVDEQHRFGVAQRTAIMQKGDAPDLLLMTATPIPRTLALTAFGDLEVSTIRTMPAGRLPVITHLAREGNEGKVYERVRGELARGRQAYFVYPLIGESAALAVKDAESARRTLAEEIYPGFPVALIHSRLPEEEKLAAMSAFAAGKVKVLVATSVVEVGVDVANAACMVVEHAERFGLSTLHQLRGRVGRGPGQSWAFLVYGSSLTPEGVERLRIMKETTDGFAIAERDLQLRGPGEMLGLRQSGYLNFRAADLGRHGALLLQARAEAKALLAEDPGLLAPGRATLARAVASLAARGPWAAAEAVLDGG
jgi:ATP-dependent DNA helicase RecG